MFNIESSIKPHRNLFGLTNAQANKYSSELRTLPDAKYFRRDLVPFVNSIVYIECSKWSINPDFVDGKRCDRILLINANIVAAKKTIIEYPIYIQHIWTVVDEGWKKRVNERYAKSLYLKGFLYLYESKGKKNIGFQTLYCKTIRKER